MNEQKQHILARRWVRDDGADIFEYRLRRVDGDWKVVTAEHWGAYGAHGQVVVGGRERF